MGKKRLKPSRGREEGRLRVTKTGSAPLREPIVFCLRRMASGYTVSDCDSDDRAAFAEKLYRLSQLTWPDVYSSHRHGLGAEKIARGNLRPCVQDRIPEDVAPIAFRFSGKKPMIGYREESILRIVALDPKFEAYPHS